MNSRKLICVLSLSKRDIFQDGIEFAANWLRKKGENPYYFRERKPKNGLPPGSIVLFSFLGQIFGQATVKEDVREVPLEKQRQLKKKHGFVYKHCMILKGSSIEIFRDHPRKKKVAPVIGKNFAQLFTYLDRKQYQQILKMARAQ